MYDLRERILIQPDYNLVGLESWLTYGYLRPNKKI